jgi:phosphate transport system substrate-binding protein
MSSKSKKNWRRINMKKNIWRSYKAPICVLALIALTAALAGCGGGNNGDAGTPDNSSASSFDPSAPITVVSREDGSGTRGAFIELFEIEKEGEDGSKKDMTTKESVIAKQTDVMMTNVAGDPYAIGYISLGSVNDTIKPLSIEGVEATADNVKNGSYQIVRPFNIATKGAPTGLAADFISYIMSADGQNVVNGEHYIPVDDAASPYAGARQSGKIVVAGSSSVTPVMEKLKEAYIALNPDVNIEIQMSDSSAGLTAAMEGTCDIAMASRELKDTESQLTPLQIALDGIAVIVNNENPLPGLTKEQVKSIFTGNITEWNVVEN